MNRRDLILFGLLGAGVVGALFLRQSGGGVSIGRVGSTVSIGSDLAGLLAGILPKPAASSANPSTSSSAAASSEPDPRVPPANAFQIGNTWYVGDSMGRPRVWSAQRNP